MNVGELKKYIKDLPDEMEVIIQKDGEGNGFSPLSGLDSNAVYIPDSTWDGYVYSMSWTSDDACVGEEEWEGIKSNPRSLILVPTN